MGPLGPGTPEKVSDDVEETRCRNESFDTFAGTHAPVDAGQLGVLWFAAQLHSAGNTQVPFDVNKRLGQAQRSLIEQRDPSWRSYLGWFEIYLALSATPPAEVRNALLLPAQP